MEQISGKKIGGATPSLDTLAQVPPKSTKITLQKRARSKWYTQQVVRTLVDMPSPLNKYYWNAYHCGSVIEQEGKTLKSKFCKTRVCNVCNRIRTANAMNGYMSQLKQLPGLKFVTLTQGKRVQDWELRDTIKKMNQNFVLLNRHLREKKGIKINGVRVIECTYCERRNTYHPHFHLIVDKYAETLVDEWLQRYPNAVEKAQDIREVDESGFNELFKYTTKIITKGKKGDVLIHATALDTILQSFKGIRTFVPFGDIRKVNEDLEGLEKQEYTDIPEYPFATFVWEDCDWSRRDEEGRLETLTGYTPPDIEFTALYS